MAKKLNAAGGYTVTGPLTVGTGDVSRPLTLTSSYAGGQDDGAAPHFDSTSRLNLESYQRANWFSYGEVIRIYSRKWDSKQMIAWYGPTSYTTYDPATDTGGDPVGPYQGWAWIGAHYEANDHGSIHGHWSIETPDAAGLLRTRLAINIWDPTTGTYGQDKTQIITNQADFVVRTSTGQVLRLAGAAADKKPIEFSNDVNGTVAATRWQFRTDGSAEAGSNAGSDLEIARYNDSGVQQDSPFFITRSNGRITIGGASGSAAGVTLNRNAASAVALTVAHTGTGGIATSITSADVTSRIFQAQVAGDTSFRTVLFADGKLELGPGSATRDTNLYRNAADSLKTDDSLVVGARLAVGQAASSDVIAATSDGTVSALVIKSSAVGTATRPVVAVETTDVTKRAVDYRLTGDAVSRLRVDASSTGSGTLTFGDGTTADVNLYRSAANVLKTDDSLVVVGTITSPSLGGAAGLNVGATAGTVAAGDDARLTNARTPTAHATTHATGGSDPLTPANIGADPTGTATSAVSTHVGLADPHTQYLNNTRGDARYETPTGAQTKATQAKTDANAYTDTSFTTHAAASNPHPIYLTQAEGDALYQPVGGAASAGSAFPLSGYGFSAASDDPVLFQAALSLGNDTLYLTKVWIPAGTAINKLWIAVKTAGTFGSSSTPNCFGLYTDTGTQVTSTATDNTLYTVAGWRGGDLLAAQASQGTGRFVYVGFLVGGMTSAQGAMPASGVDANNTYIGLGNGITSRRAIRVASTTTLPSSFNPTSFGTPTGNVPLVAVS